MSYEDAILVKFTESNCSPSDLVYKKNVSSFTEYDSNSTRKLQNI